MSVFGAAFGLIGVLWTGLSISDYSTMMASAGALLLGIARATKYFADARLTRAEAKIKETYVNPEVYHLLERIKCWRVDCPTREIFKPETAEHS